MALSLLGDSLLYAVLPARPEDFGVLVWQIGILLGANRLVRLVTNELAGRILNRSRSNKPLILAVIAGSLVTASYALPWGFWGLLSARIIWGACWSFLRVEGYVSALALSTDRNRGRIFALYQAVTRLGSGGGVLVGGFLSDLLGIPWTFLIFSLITSSGFFLVLKAPVDRAPDPGLIRPAPQDSNSGPLPRDKLQIFLWGCALAVTMTEQMIANLTGRLVADRIAPGLSIQLGVASLTGLLLSFRSFGSLVFSPLAGALSDRIGRKKLLLILSFLQMAIISLLIFSAHWLLNTLLLALQFMAGISSRLIIYTVAGDRAPPERKELHMSRFSTFVDLGTALGPVVGFSIYAGSGFLWVAVIALALLTFIIGTVVRGDL